MLAKPRGHHIIDVSKRHHQQGLPSPESMHRECHVLRQQPPAASAAWSCIILMLCQHASSILMITQQDERPSWQRRPGTFLSVLAMVHATATRTWRLRSCGAFVSAARSSQEASDTRAWASPRDPDFCRCSTTDHHGTLQLSNAGRQEQVGQAALENTRLHSQKLLAPGVSAMARMMAFPQPNRL